MVLPSLLPGPVVSLSGALSLASPGVPGNCRKQCSVPGKLPGDPMVVLVGQMGILSAHAWCGTSVKNTMEETINNLLS